MAQKQVCSFQQPKKRKDYKEKKRFEENSRFGSFYLCLLPLLESQHRCAFERCRFTDSVLLYRGIICKYICKIFFSACGCDLKDQEKCALFILGYSTLSQYIFLDFLLFYLKLILL